MNLLVLQNVAKETRNKILARENTKDSGMR